jgi:hypothetical protein
MTIIVTGAPTKKALKNWADGTRWDGVSWPATVCVNIVFQDPSTFKPLHDGRYFTLEEMEIGESFICTNHPKRSWFATVTRIDERRWKVS